MPKKKKEEEEFTLRTQIPLMLVLFLPTLLMLTAILVFVLMSKK